MMHGDNNPFGKNKEFSAFFNKDLTEFKIDRTNVYNYVKVLESSEVNSNDIRIKALNFALKNGYANHLKSITIEDCQFVFDDIYDNENINNLTQLIQQSKVEELVVNDIKLGKELEGFFNNLSNKPALKKLTLQQMNFDEKAQDALLNLIRNSNSLQELNLPNCNLDAQFINKLSEALKESGTVKVLNLSDNNFNIIENAKALANLIKNNKQITKIYINNSQINNEGIEILSEAFKDRDIELLSISNNDFLLEEDIKALSNLIKNCKSINDLIFTHNNVKKGFIEMFNEASNGKISSLNLLSSFSEFFFPSYDDHLFTYESLKALLNNNKLKSLCLNPYLFDKHILALSEELKNNKTLEHLDLSSVNLEGETLNNITDIIKNNKSIKILNLDSIKFKPEQLKLISNAIKNNNTLLELKLSSSHVKSLPENAEVMQEINRNLERNRKALKIAGIFTSMVLKHKSKLNNKTCEQPENSLFALPVDVLAEVAKFIPGSPKDCENFRDMILGRKSQSKSQGK